jgi:hypothetical protein
MEARMMAEREAERVAHLADQQMMTEMFQYMQSLGPHKVLLHHLGC